MMEKQAISTMNSGRSYTFKTQESYSPEEIFAAGGTTAFAIKIGKTGKNLRESVKNAPEAEFTDEEWEIIQEQLKNDK
jgi:hypothetical protein